MQKSHMDASRSFCVTTVLKCGKHKLKIPFILFLCLNPVMFSALLIVEAGARNAGKLA